jgi:hypothetical protein
MSRSRILIMGKSNMHKTVLLALASASFVIAGSPAAFAQEEDKGPEFAPLETFTCDYREGKGPADLDDAVDTWTAYMDENDADQYLAMTMTPQMHGSETFDVGWLGVAPTGEEMGQGRDGYRANGGESAAAFDAVLDCNTHSQFASLQIKEPPERENPGNLVISFSDCEIEEDLKFSDVVAGLRAWGEYQAANGYSNGTWALFPAYGSGDEDFDFKLVHAYDNHAGMGRDFDLYGTGGGFMKRREIMGDMLDCNVGRVYDGTVRRTINDEE